MSPVETRIVSIVGARPQFVKFAAIADASKGKILHGVVRIGRHYDFGMSGRVFEELEISDQTVNLGVRSGSHSALIGRMIIGSAS